MRKMKDSNYADFEPSFLDSDYRNRVAEALEHATFVEILGNDLSCINYPEILFLVKETSDAGSNIHIYFSDAPSRILDFLKRAHVSLYKVSARIIEERIVINGSKVISSKVSDGMRQGFWKIDDEYAKSILNSFELSTGTQRPILKSPQYPIHSVTVRATEHEEDAKKLIVAHEELAAKFEKSLVQAAVDNLDEILDEERQRSV